MMLSLGFLFEVMDKEPTLIGLWVWTIGWSMLGVLACRYRSWLGIFTFLFGQSVPYGTILEIKDPDVGRYILLEAGHFYVNQVYLAFWWVILIHLFGFLLYLRRRSTAKRLVLRKSEGS